VKSVQLLVISFLLSLICYSQPIINWQKTYGGTTGVGASKMIISSQGGYVIVGNAWTNDGDVSGNHGSPDVWVIKTDTAGNLQWQKCLGGSSGEEGIDIVEVSGGYAIVGFCSEAYGDVTQAFGYGDFWAIKIDDMGHLVWQKTYGGINMDDPYCIDKTPDGGIVISGSENSPDSGYTAGSHVIPPVYPSDFWIIKLDSMGNLQWERCLGGYQGDTYGGGCIRVDSEGYIYGVSTSGSTDGDVTCHIGMPFHGSAWLVKLDSDGNLLWDRCYGGTNLDIIYSIQVKSDKLLMCGRSRSTDYDLPSNYGGYDAWILLTDTSGDIIYSRNYGSSVDDEFLDAKFLSDSKIIAAGDVKIADHDVNSIHYSSVGLSDGWLVCLDSIGNIIWEKCYGGSNAEGLVSVFSLPSGGFILGSGTDSNDGDAAGSSASLNNTRIWLINLNAVVGINEFNPQNNFSVYPNPSSGIFQLKTNNYSRKSLFVYDMLGNVIWQEQSNSKIETTIDISNYPKGIYFVKISQGDKITTQKIVLM
jgi:hypothetical protein